MGFGFRGSHGQQRWRHWLTAQGHERPQRGLCGRGEPEELLRGARGQATEREGVVGEIF